MQLTAIHSNKKRWHHEILYWLQEVKRPYHWCSTTSPCNTLDLERSGTGENFLNYRSEERVLASTAPSSLKKIYSFRHFGWRAISIPSGAIRVEECTLYLSEYNEGSLGYFLEKICNCLPRWLVSVLIHHRGTLESSCTNIRTPGNLWSHLRPEEMSLR